MIMFRRICWIGIIFLTANIPFLKAGGIGLFWRVLCVPAFIAVNIMPTIRNRRMARLRYRICADGCELLIYFLAVAWHPQFLCSLQYQFAFRLRKDYGLRILDV